MCKLCYSRSRCLLDKWHVDDNQIDATVSRIIAWSRNRSEPVFDACPDSRGLHYAFWTRESFQGSDIQEFVNAELRD